MKSMTDFIMEQEITNTAVEEVFEESTLVSNYMALCASAKMMECMCEFATIGAFCESNEIAVPTVIQEGWTEFWNGVKNFFKNIAEWFKSLVKGTISAVAKASLPAIIAKLKQRNPDKPVKEDKVIFMARATELVWSMLIDFKDMIIGTGDLFTTDATTGKIDETDKTNKMILKIDDLKDDLDKVIGDKAWKDESVLKNFDSKYSGTGIKELIKNENYNLDNMTIGDLIRLLERINKMNIPNEGKKLIKEIDKNADRFKTVKTATQDDEDGHVGIKKDDKYVVDKKDDELIKKLKKTSTSFAKAYDKITQGLIAITQLEFDDTEIKDQEKFDADVRRAENATKSKTFDTNSTAKQVSSIL